MRAAKPLTPGDAFNQMHHLFGQAITDVATPAVPSIPDAKEDLPAVPKPLPRVLPDGQAVWPMIDNTSFGSTMDNFRLYRDNYNKWVKQENELINKHNALVDLIIESGDLTETERIMVNEFHKKFTKPDKRQKGAVRLNDREYNEVVDDFCEGRRALISKRKIQPLRPQAELHFQQMLYLYSIQVNDQTERFMKHAITSSRPLQDLEIRSDKVNGLRRKNGAQSLTVVNKTVRNQRARLQEAGVLTDYVYQGSYNGVRNKINPEILVFTDLFLVKQAKAENQLVSSTNRKKFPVISYDLSTQTSKNECEIKDDAPQSSDDKVFAPQTPLSTTKTHSTKTHSTKTLGSKIGNSPGAAPSESVKVEKTLSEKLREHIADSQELAVDLAAGKYFNYVPIDVRLIHNETSAGTLTPNEFRELIIQDCFKEFSKAYRNSTAYVGSWKKAINEWMDNRWMIPLSRSAASPMNKSTIAGYIEEYRWCIKNALQWFMKTGVTPLFPGDYFDMSRKTKGEVGFEYQRQRYKKHVRGIEKKEEAKKKRDRNAELRKIKMKNDSRLRTETNRFIKGKITLPQLEKYVKDNLPAQFYADLPAYLHKRMNNL